MKTRILLGTATLLLALALSAVTTTAKAAPTVEPLAPAMYIATPVESDFYLPIGLTSNGGTWGPVFDNGWAYPAVFNPDGTLAFMSDDPGWPGGFSASGELVGMVFTGSGDYPAVFTPLGAMVLVEEPGIATHANGMGGYGGALGSSDAFRVLPSGRIDRRANARFIGFRGHDGILMIDADRTVIRWDASNPFLFSVAVRGIGVECEGSLIAGADGSERKLMATVWDTKKPTKLGRLDGETGSIARAVNTNGIAVGTSFTDDEFGRTFTATRYTGRRSAERLQDLIDGASGVTLHFAIDIAENGVILADGTDNQGNGHTYLLTPALSLQ